MKANTSTFTLALLIGALGAGCASSASDAMPQSNTGRGAVAGAAAGAVIGGIIGNNRGSGNAASGAAIGAAAGGLAGAAIGNQADRRQENANASYDSGRIIQAPPPTPTSQPYEQIPPRPAGNVVWIPGHYAYTGANYEWTPGRWEYPPAGATSWVPPTWQPQGNGYIYVRGHWQ